ncbi:MAG: thioesterase family protein [Porticoccaceae bacterium]
MTEHSANFGEFHRDTAVERVADNVWQGVFSDGWCIGKGLNGGYVMALGARALSAALPHKDPLAVTAYYLARTEPGPVRCEVDVLRSGGSVSFGNVRMIQNGQLKVQLTGVYTDADKLNGAFLSADAMPDIPPIDACDDMPQADSITLRQRLLQRATPANVAAMNGAPDNSGRWLGWTALADGSDIDAFALLMFADSFPPPSFTLYGPLGWVPTLELTVQIHGRPARGPLRCEFKTALISNGIVDEEGTLWDSTGRVVAVCRQTALLKQG